MAILKKIGIVIFGLILILTILVTVKINFIGKKMPKNLAKDYCLQGLNQHNIRLDFLGTAGMLISKDSDAILIDPFFSNPNLIFKNKSYKWTSYFDVNILSKINLIAISHGHYDHCYDIKELLPIVKKPTAIVANSSIFYQISSILEDKKHNTIGVKDKISDWIYNKDSTIRVIAIPSVHAPHIGCMKFLSGSYTENQNKYPLAIWKWKEGATYSYIVDIMEKDSVVYRVAQINGDIKDKNLQYLFSLDESKNIDLMMCIFWKYKLNFPRIKNLYKNINPSNLVLIHWNNFFQPLERPLEYFKSSNLPKALSDFEKNKIPAKIILPMQHVNL